MSHSPRNSTEQILDLLLDALQERQKARDEATRIAEERKKLEAKAEDRRMKAEDLTVANTAPAEQIGEREATSPTNARQM